MSGDASTDAIVRPVRVLLVAPSMDMVGGQSIQAQRLLKALHESSVVAAGFLPVNPRLPGALSLLQKVKYVRTVVTSLAYFYTLLRDVRKYDVIHAFSASYWSYLLAPFPAMFVARLCGKPAALNYRSGEALDHLTNWRTAVRTIRRYATSVVTPSGYLVDVFSRFGIPARAIPNFVDLERFRYRAREATTPKFFCNRNHEAHYNVATVLRAFRRIQREYPDATIVIAGDGPLRGDLEYLARDLGINAVFTGRVGQAEMAELYDQADVYLNAPLIDNMPGSILEAFACGLPVVTTNAGGIPWIVRDGENGLMVEAGDTDATADALASAAIRLLREPSLATRIAESARTELERRYIWPVVKRQWEQLYRELYRMSKGQSAGVVRMKDSETVDGSA